MCFRCLQRGELESIFFVIIADFTWESLWIIVESWGILVESWGILVESWGILWNFEEFYGILRNSMESWGILWNLEEFYGILKNLCIHFLGRISWNPCITFRNTCRMLWNLCRNFENLKELCELLTESSGILFRMWNLCRILKIWSVILSLGWVVGM